MSPLSRSTLTSFAKIPRRVGNHDYLSRKWTSRSIPLLKTWVDVPRAPGALTLAYAHTFADSRFLSINFDWERQPPWIVGRFFRALHALAFHVSLLLLFFNFSSISFGFIPRHKYFSREASVIKFLCYFGNVVPLWVAVRTINRVAFWSSNIEHGGNFLLELRRMIRVHVKKLCWLSIKGS